VVWLALFLLHDTLGLFSSDRAKPGMRLNANLMARLVWMENHHKSKAPPLSSAPAGYIFEQQGWRDNPCQPRDSKGPLPFSRAERYRVWVMADIYQKFLFLL
jgi:hypothetical protein